MPEIPTILPPQELESEQAVIAACLHQEGAVGHAIDVIGKDDAVWMDHRHAIAYPIICEQYERGKILDHITLAHEIRKRGMTEQVGDLRYFADLFGSSMAYWNVRQHAGLVRRAARKRALVTTLRSAADGAMQADSEPATIIEQVSQKLLDLRDSKEQPEADFVYASLAEIVQQIESKEQSRGIPTGMYGIDNKTGGWQPGDVAIVAARPSMGKTAFAVCSALHIAERERRPILFFSLEMSRQSIAQRLLSLKTGVDMLRMRNRMCSEDDVRRLRQAVNELQNVPFIISDRVAVTPLGIRAEVYRQIQQHGIVVVFVDYIQLIRIGGRIENRQQEVSQISSALKAIARDMNIAIVALAQLNRKTEDRTESRPRMSDLRESGSLEQDADAVILLHREEYYHKGDERWAAEHPEKVGTAEAIIDKQRNGPTGVVQLAFSGVVGRFSDLAEEAYKQYAQQRWTPTEPEAEPEPLYEQAEATSGEVPF